MTKRESWKQKYQDHHKKAMEALQILKGGINKEAWEQYKAESKKANHSFGVMLRCNI